MQKSEFYKSKTAEKEIVFDDGEKLVVQFATIKQPYRWKKDLLGMIQESQKLVKDAGQLNKRIGAKRAELEASEDEGRKVGLQTAISALETELKAVNEQVKDYTAPFADYLILEDNSPRRVLLGWDLVDGDEAVECNREQLEDLPDEVIVFIAGQLLSEGEVGESKPAK
jgi:hypothetical protein